METNQAAEHLQVIRTLMERSAIYRRALAPIMSYCGGVGIAGGLAGWAFGIRSTRGFLLFWSGVALTALLGSFLLVRRQAFKDAEVVWSPPTRRVTQALVPPLFIGCFFNLCLAYMVRGNSGGDDGFHFIVVWLWFYGCAIHSAGFFMTRGIRLLSWLFILAGCALFALALERDLLQDVDQHLLMAGLFGGIHLAYGSYLFFTEKRNPSMP